VTARKGLPFIEWSQEYILKLTELSREEVISIWLGMAARNHFVKCKM
jgi:hypothetical protein